MRKSQICDTANMAFALELPSPWWHIVLTNLVTGGGDFGGIDFSKLGGAGGMPDFGAMGGEEDEDDDDDDDMPALEGEEEGAKAETTAKAEDGSDAKEVVSS
jgi:hypothetical protein